MAIALLVAVAAPVPAHAARFGDDLEELLVGAAVLAGVVAVLANVLKDEVDDWERDRRTRGDGVDRPDDDRSRAVDDCTRTAQRQAERHGVDPRVRDIDVEREGDDYVVTGEVEVTRDTGWEGDARETDRVGFTCSARDGRVTTFRFTGNFDYAALD
ncbi:MAG: hypothetical protein Q7J32_04565 [Sphingomonadaceae bacterium]|nr:hypothetical protein [Sphingomonadaceae bacterium]